MPKPNKENIITTILAELEKGIFNTEIPADGYYVYVVYNRTLNQILYIGKGKNKRVLFHFKNKNSYLNIEINSLKSKGFEIVYSIIKYFKAEKMAYKYETKIIKECLKQEIEIYNIAQTHKDIFVKNSFRECVLLLSEFMRRGYVEPNKNKEILSIQQATDILLERIKAQCLTYPKLAVKYKLQNVPVLDINKILLLPNRSIMYVNKQE